MIDYKKRLVEVDEVLNHLSKEDYNKIPQKLIQAIKENKDTEYIWEYDEEKSLKDQGLSRDTLILISCINMEYLLNDSQKEYVEYIHKINGKK